MVTILLVGLASGALALGIARGKPLQPLHEALWPHRDGGSPRPRGARGWIAELASCPWCLGAWLCAGLWALQGLPAGIVAPVAWGAAWAISTVTAWGLERALEG